MKQAETKRRRLAGLMALALGLGGAAGALADSWTEAVPETSINTDAGEGCPIETADGLSLMIASTRTGSEGLDIWTADRPAINAPFAPAVKLPAPINGPAQDFCPSPVLGNYLMFVSDRGMVPDVCGGGDMYIARLNPAGSYGTPRLLGCEPLGPNSSGPERSPWIVETRGLTYLFYSSNGGSGDHDIYVSFRRLDGTFSPGRVIAAVSSDSDDFMPNVRRRSDGRYEMVFNSNRPTWGDDDEMAYGGQDVYYSRARSPMGRWSTPRNLGPAVNTAMNETRSGISTDGNRLHFGRSAMGVPGDIYVSERRR